ncbi:MAG: MarR family transcriptional regulator [Spirochaetes bacterium]|nr:MarR family transcriptional regulator [Spirochaetota bacterium]MBX3722860.1 MarR family transcriptional regulator [Turneriella sp.]
MDQQRIIHLLSRTRDRIQKRFQRKIDALELGNIAPAHGSVLYVLKDGPLPMQDLARLIERDNSTVTTLADKLEKQRFVKRNVAEHDTRSHIISITPKGAQAASQIIAASRATVGEIFAGFSDSERTAFTELLQRVYKNMED